LGIDNRYNAVDRDSGFDFRPVERLHQRLREGQSRSFDDDMFWMSVAVDELAHRRDEIFRDRAANAAIGKFDDVVLAARIATARFEDFAIHSDIAELVDDESNPPTVGGREQVADERGFAGSEEAGDDRGGDLLHDWTSRRTGSYGRFPMLSN